MSAVLLLAPAALAALAGVRLTAAAWSIGGFGPGGGQDFDPVVAWFGGARGDESPPASERALEKAGRLAKLDHRYPYRLGLRYWFPSGAERSGADAFQASEFFREAARRAPSHARARYYLSQAAGALGQDALADREALAALLLAPQNRDLRRRISRHFQARYRETGRAGDLSAAIRTMDGDLARAIAALREDPTLTYERTEAAFRSAKADPDWAVDALIVAERFDWAVRYAQSLDSGPADPHREGRARISVARHRYEAGAVADARREIEEARRLLDGTFGDYRLLGEIRLSCEDVPGGLDALRFALDAGEHPGAVAAVLSRRLSPAAEVDFWARRTNPGPEVSLELAAAEVRAGRTPEAEATLRDLLDDPVVGARANFLMARALVQVKNPAMALRYAREALARSPGNAEYRALLAELED